MEAVSCARVRLLAAQGESDAAEALASSLCAVASERGLVRTLLRGLALSMVAAEAAGHTDRALARLVEFLSLTREVYYVRPLVRHRKVSRALLRKLIDTDSENDVREAARLVLAELDERPTTSASAFSARELEVLAGVADGLRNKEIARRLGITDEGVRYHLRNIYRKTGASRRGEVVRYAQSRSAGQNTP